MMSDQDVANICQNDDDNDDDDDDDDAAEATTGVAAAEAGITRGALRSLGRSAVRLPAVGRLPVVSRRGGGGIRTSPPAAVRPRLQVKQIARVSDRVSTGLDLLSTAQTAELRWKLSRFQRLVTIFVKNTVLGIASFETYCKLVEQFASAPPASSVPLSQSSIGGETTAPVDDAYARASLSLHAIAGLAGGVAHGLVETAWDSMAAATAAAARKAELLAKLHRTALYHGASHSSLFASYEGIKRFLFPLFDEAEITRVEYLGCVATAGGLAGMAQHVFSYYIEPVVLKPTGGINSLRAITQIPRPALRPLLFAFVPTSIAFVAFEYGRSESYVQHHDEE